MYNTAVKYLFILVLFYSFIDSRKFVFKYAFPL